MPDLSNPLGRLQLPLTQSVSLPVQARYQWLQCFRGLAALFVVLFHFLPQVERYGLTPWLAPVFSWGFWGVDIFFVLSGFVIAMSATKLSGVRDGTLFMAKRGLRIYLGYWPALALWVALLVATARPVEMGLALDSIFLLSGKTSAHWLPIAWTLYYELLFYLLFFLLILWVPASRRFLWISAFLLGICLWNGYWISQQTETVMSGLQPYRELLSGCTIEFFLGVLLYRARAFFVRDAERMLCLLALLVLGLAIGMHSPWFATVEILKAGSFGLAAAAAVGLALCLEGLPAPRLLVRIGDASYALYMTHIVVLDGMIWLIDRKLGLLSPLGGTLVLLIPVIAVLVALVWYRLIEQPLYQFALKCLPGDRIRQASTLNAAAT